MFRDKRRAILDAATKAFSQHGLRRASMDLIAERAQVAKPTIYAHFGSKDELFAAVCADVGEHIQSRAQAAADVKAPLVERVTGVLAAKFTVVFELVQSSAYAEELLHPPSAPARENIAAADAAFRSLLSGVLSSATRKRELDVRRLGITEQELTAQLMQVGYGASYGAASKNEQLQNLRALVGTVLRSGVPPKKGRTGLRGG